MLPLTSVDLDPAVAEKQKGKVRMVRRKIVTRHVKLSSLFQFDRGQMVIERSFQLNIPK